MKNQSDSRRHKKRRRIHELTYQYTKRKKHTHTQYQRTPDKRKQQKISNGNPTWVLEEEPIRALARAPSGLEEEEPGAAQSAPPVTKSRIAISID